MLWVLKRIVRMKRGDQEFSWSRKHFYRGRVTPAWEPETPAPRLWSTQSLGVLCLPGAPRAGKKAEASEGAGQSGDVSCLQPPAEPSYQGPGAPAQPSGELNLEQKKGKTRGAGGGEEDPASGQGPRDKVARNLGHRSTGGGVGDRAASSVCVSNKAQAVGADAPSTA